MEQNFIHYLEYSTTRKDEDDMSKITNVVINNVRINDILEVIYSKIDPRNNLRDPVVNLTFQALPKERKKTIGTSMLIFRYCIHRILTHFKIYLDSNWNKFTLDDYYSQEVSAIHLKPELSKVINENIDKLSSLSDDKKIEHVLMLEHKRLISVATNKHWKICEIHSDDLIFTNKSLLQKCTNIEGSYLKKYNLPRGLCYKTDNKYRVIDGYHRLAPMLDDKRFLIIYNEDED